MVKTLSTREEVFKGASMLILSFITLVIIFFLRFHLIEFLIIPFSENKFKIRLYIAHKSPNFYYHEGLLRSSRAMRLPQARVLYPCGMESMSMPIGNALSYSKIFKGKLVEVK
jgi:hypothetical protein